MAIKTLLFPLGGGAILAAAANAWLLAALPVTQAAVPDITTDDLPLDAPSSLTGKDLDAILQRNIFGFVEEANPALVEEDPFAKLPLKLVGTIAALGGGIAVLERTDAQPSATNSFRVGEAVLQDVILEAVYQGKATFLRDGKRIALLVEEKPKAERRRGRPETIPAAKPAATPGFEKKGDDVKVSRDYVEHVLADMPTLLTSLKATPHMEGGEFRGFLLSAIKPGSIAEQLGIEEGDLVTAINDTTLVGVATSVQQLQDLKSATNVSFTILRDGEEKRIAINVH